MPKIILPPTYPMYLAFGEQGEFVRKAQMVGELPDTMRLDALRVAAKVLNVTQIQYGVPLFRTLGLTKSELDADKRGWLRFTGEQLPLKLFWDETLSEEEA